MKRRGFLKLLGLVPAAPLLGRASSGMPNVVPAAAPSVEGDFNIAEMRYKAYERFGAAQLKPEGSAVDYDAPAFSFTNDTDTGLYRSGASRLGISTISKR